MEEAHERSGEGGVPATHWLSSPPRRSSSKARMFGQIGLVLWAAWLVMLWRISEDDSFDSQTDWWWRQAMTQAAFWLALLFTGVWVAATVARDERRPR